MNPELEKAIAKLRSLGASDQEVAEYVAEYRKQTGGSTALEQGRSAIANAPQDVRNANTLQLDVRQRPESTNALPFNRENPTGDFEAAAPSMASLPLIAAQVIPGMESYQAAAGMVGSRLQGEPLSFEESRDALRSVTDNVPAPIKLAAQAPMLVKSAAALALTPAKAGAAVGAADQALSADDMSMGERAARTATGGVVGGAVGKALETGGTIAQAYRAPALEANIMARETANKAAARPVYQRAFQEAGASGVAGPATSIQSVLANPEMATYVKLARSSGGPLSDGETMHRTFKLLSKETTSLKQQLAKEYDAAKELKLERLNELKASLLAAADETMPSYRKAVQQFAEGKGEVRAVKTGKTAASRAISKTSSAHPETQSAEALTQRIMRLPENERKAAIQGMLGRLRETIGMQPNAVSLGGSMTTALRPGRLTPYLRKLGAKDTDDDLARLALMLGAGVTP